MRRGARTAAAPAALIFDMDGTMIDSMPYHAKSWVAFARRHGIEGDADSLMRRTSGRTGLECIRELFGRELAEAEALALCHEKEAIYRELFAPSFAEVRGFARFAAQAAGHGLKIGFGTAGDRDNIAFALLHLKLAFAPHAVVGGDEGLPGKPEPAIFLEAARRLGADPRCCIVFEDTPAGIEAARRAGMRAVAMCTGHSAAELAGAHVVAQARDYDELMQAHFLRNLIT
jgi:beta-phosphoglucomutase-like phosphatase (HAD superfamily)